MALFGLGVDGANQDFTLVPSHMLEVTLRAQRCQL